MTNLNISRRYDFTVNHKEAEMLKEMLAGDIEMAKVDLTRFASGLFNEEPRVLIVVAAQKHKQIDANVNKGMYIQYVVLT